MIGGVLESRGNEELIDDCRADEDSQDDLDDEDDEEDEREGTLTLDHLWSDFLGQSLNLCLLLGGTHTRH